MVIILKIIEIFGIFMKILRFFLKFAVFLLFFSGFALAEDSKYVVERVAVEVEGDSPADARNLAFKSARKRAFATLLYRLGYKESFILEVDDEEIAQMVRLERVFGERIYGNKYSAAFKIVFAKDFVDDMFLRKRSKKEVAGSGLEDLRFLVIPVKLLGQKSLLWEDGNDFRTSINAAITGQDLHNFKTIEADIDNLSILGGDSVNSVEIKDLQYLFKKYNVDIIYLAFFSYDRHIAKASVMIRGFERDRKFQYRLGFINSKSLNDVDLIDRVGYKVMKYLSGLNMEEIRAQGVENDMVRLEIPVRKLEEWLIVKRRIENSDFVEKMDIETVSRDYVRVSVLCRNSLEITKVFAKMGFELHQRGQNVYLLLLK